MKYTVSADQGKGFKDVAKFGRRSEALEFANFHKNVKVVRQTPKTTREVFSRSVSKGSNGFTTVVEKAVYRDTANATA